MIMLLNFYTGYLTITIPEPPFPPNRNGFGYQEPAPPPPPPVFATPVSPTPNIPPAAPPTATAAASRAWRNGEAITGVILPERGCVATVFTGRFHDHVNYHLQ